jgi:hypothetical protein
MKTLAVLVLMLAAAPAPTAITFNDDKAGGAAAQFEGVVGDWAVSEAGGQKGLLVDGSRWRQGLASASLADQAKRLYGERYAEFLDGVKAYAFFPLAVWKGDCSGDDVTLSMRFFPIAGKIDQGAGIAFGIDSHGTYFGTRANALEDNLLFFKVVKGKRSVSDTIRGVHTSTKEWHTLRVHLQGRAVKVELDGKERLAKQLDAPPQGRCGLWSKADSQVLFDDFTVVRGGGATR